MMKSSSFALPRMFSSMPISGRIGVILVSFWVVIALIGPFISPHDGGQVVSQDVFLGSSMAFPLGTDYLGRDVLSRILYGTRYTVGLALTAAVLASSIGIGLGLFATVNGRYVDAFVSRIIDALISIPSKMLALVIVAAFGSSIPLLITIAALSFTPGAFRIARSLAVNLQTLEYVQVAKVRGEGRFYVAWVEILPNMIHPMLADFGLRFVFIVLLLSGLSFLGLGVQPPHADLGSLVRENISGLGQGALAVIAPSFAIATLTVGVNILIDSLPRLGLRTGGES
ncbi:ABC transporter permease [Pigmentiphaga aceris]|uniref:ABC transporter permease n=1 Tax=Pigmentiphaga aceris TaxID=1940612 RepID=A0A5C0AW52_9BURK|nr:ABC transporter permease [Pigmentiphaga aceris]QEI06682.1 ABC transporter permease [Pigmentiphaga aceris]